MKNQKAMAHLKGSAAYPHLHGIVYFLPFYGGTVVKAKVKGFPLKPGPIRFQGFHIHQSGDCGNGNLPEPFPNTGGHYNPGGQVHGFHAGDLPPLPVSDGISLLSFYTGAFKPEDIIGRSVVIHENSDDFHTDPSGNSGRKIACGKIIPIADD